MKFDVYSYTNKGGRDYNEDFCGHLQDVGKGVFVIADGLGGHGHGEVASEIAVNYILNTAKSDLEIDDAYLLEIMNGANNAVINHQNSEPVYKNIRTTVAAAFFSEDVFKYFNVGDSRLYYFKNGCLYSQSKDHSVPQMAANMGEITTEEIRNHEDRSKLLKVLGDVENLNIKKIVQGVKIEKGDAFILCTDGFWEYVFETEMELDLLKSSSPKEWCEFMCKRLLRRVTGNNDNFTVLCGIMTSPIVATAWMPEFTPVEATPKKSSGKKKFILAGILSMIVLIGCIAAWFVLDGLEEYEKVAEDKQVISEDNATMVETEDEYVDELEHESDEDSVDEPEDDLIDDSVGESVNEHSDDMETESHESDSE